MIAWIVIVVLMVLLVAVWWNLRSRRLRGNR
jgi:uncharacterized membrane protein YwzB